MNRKWMREVRDWMDKGMCGLLPIYDDDGGNYTKLIFENDSPIIIKKRTNTILVRLAAFFQKDIRLIRAQAREVTGRRNMNPLPITQDIILVPFKVRKPIGKDDGAVGYFYHRAIENIIEEKESVGIVLRDGQEYDILDTYPTAKHHIACAHQIYYHLLQRDLRSFNPYGLCQECAGVYNQPATKADFVTLSRNLEELTCKLKKLQNKV
ncbi:MAG: hypothetical protein GX375_03440 [Clostridiales bacterium]|nr:hypothetical protein [Clostridiales bacterium]